MPAAAEVGEPEAVQRELLAGQRLSHPGIAAILASGRDNGQYWIAMEFAPGVTMSRYIEPARLLPWPVVLRVGASMADALAHAHARGVVHRDLKPSNVRLELPTEAVRLLDFGVARIGSGSHTRTGMTLGTPAYMAPEVLAGQPALAAADTYALGVMLYELLSGQRPHRGATLGDLLRSISMDPAVPLSEWCPDLPPQVVDAVHRALDKDPKTRPADLAAYADALRQMAGPPRRGDRPVQPAADD